MFTMTLGYLVIALAMSGACLAASPSREEMENELRDLLATVEYDGPKIHLSHDYDTKARALPSELEYEVGLDVVGTIAYRGYPVELHRVETSDGYLLSVYRIPGPRHDSNSNFTGPRKTVFLQHGLLDSSFTWVCNLPHQSLAFILADAGYDVWLGNVRGNTYSRAHKTLSPKKNQFWDFSFDEMARYDLPAMLNYVLAKSGSGTLSYIGHSQGGMIGLIAFGLYPELAAKINLYVGLAPASNIHNAKGGFPVLAIFDGTIDFFCQLFFDGEFLPSTVFAEWAAKHICDDDKWTSTICTSVIFILAGYDELHINGTRLPVYISKTPAGTSSKNAVHFSQVLKSDRWAHYDYGKRDNEKKYGSKQPPEYDISKMNVPSAILYSQADWLVTKIDVEGYLLPRINKLVMAKDYKDYQHLDFTWGYDAYLTLYKDVQELLQSHAR